MPSLPILVWPRINHNRVFGLFTSGSDRDVSRTAVFRIPFCIQGPINDTASFHPVAHPKTMLQAMFFYHTAAYFFSYYILFIIVEEVTVESKCLVLE